MDDAQLRLTETLAGSGRLCRPALQPLPRHGGCLRTLRAEPQVRQARNVRRTLVRAQFFGILMWRLDSGPRPDSFSPQQASMRRSAAEVDALRWLPCCRIRGEPSPGCSHATRRQGE